MLVPNYAQQQSDSSQKLSDSSQKMSDDISRYQNYLKSYYKAEGQTEDKFSIAPCDEFINLALIKKSETSSQDCKSHDVDEIVASKTPVELDSVVTPDSRFVLVEGPPGVGKSTLCLEICKKWDTLKSLQHYKIVLQLKLRENRVQNAKLNEIFFHYDEKLCQGVVDEVLKCEGEGVLLILDGFDEVPTSVVCDRSNLIMKLIYRQCIPNATLLVTSRPSALHHKKKFPKQYRHIEILGFTDDSKMKFAEIAFESKPEVLTHFKKFVFSNPIINSLMYIPINCAILAEIYKQIEWNEKLMPKTMTQLYTTLVLVLIRKHMIDNGEWDEDSELPNSLEELPESVIPTLKRVSELAYKGLFEKEVQLEFSSSDVGRDFEHMGLLSVSKEMYVTKGAKTSYSFPHLSMQEFLAAWYVSGQPDLIKEKSVLFENLNRVPAHLNAFVRFLAGMVKLNKLLLKPVKYNVNNLLLHCLFETQNPSDFDLLDVSRQHIFTSNSLDAYVLGYALVHAPIQWILNVDPRLLSSLAHHSQKESPILGSITGLTLVSAAESYSLSNLNHLFQSITTLTLTVTNSGLNSDLIAWIHAMHNLSNIEMRFQSCTCQGDYGPLNDLKKLKTASFKFYDNKITNRGMLELSNFLSNINHTLENVKIYFYGTMKCLFMGKSHPIIKSALFCPTLKSFTTNIPFVASKFPKRLKRVSFEIEKLEYSVVYTTTELSNCICSIADLCKMSSVKLLSLTKGITLNPYSISLPPQTYFNFLSILNKSLHCNPALKVDFHHDFYFDFDPFDNCSLFCQVLRRDSDILRSSIRRSNSLCDLATPTICKPKRFSTKMRSHSCPDLLELQSLRTLHPQLDKQLYCNYEVQRRMPQLYPYLKKMMW